jgi:signal transduction histidine kinase
MSLLKLMLPKTREIKTWLGLTLLVLFASIAAVPGFLITYFRYGPIPEIFTNAVWMIGISVGAFVLTSYARAIDEAREKYERELEQFNDQLAKEVALFEQRLWLERRAWSYVIHGDVQGALSAAVTRLQRSEKLEPYELEMVKQDIARAAKALTSSPAKDINFTQSLDELVRTWAGVCNIKIESSARADRAIDANLDVRNCINEICKEAVSNAVRHGNAKNAVIRLSREKDDVIELEICNDGHKPLRDQPNGMGLEMIDDLSLSWQLTAERHKNQTCLVAQLPIGNKS